MCPEREDGCDNLERWTRGGRERRRLVEALGEITDGGLVERAEHIGTISIPGLYGQLCADMVLAA
jgi:GrpB-like predicted nucleotidyltransferase (UPF0157 family)